MAKKRHTTIRLHPDIEREAKAYARSTERTFTQFVEQAVVHLMTTEERKPRKPIVLPVVGKRGGEKMSLEEYQRVIDRIYEEEAERYAQLER